MLLKYPKGQKNISAPSGGDIAKSKKGEKKIRPGKTKIAATCEPCKNAYPRAHTASLCVLAIDNHALAVLDYCVLTQAMGMSSPPASAARNAIHFDFLEAAVHSAL